MATTLTARTRHASALRSLFPIGVASARQLVAAGVPTRTVYRRCLDGGPWRRILPGIVLLFSGEPTLRQMLHAAVLLGGPDAVITGLHACRAHGLRRGPAGRAGPGEIAILVPAGRQIRSVGFVHVERTSRMPQAEILGGLPFAPIVRACTDAARRVESAAEITELLSDAVQRGLCSVAALASEMAAGSRRGTAMPSRVLADVAAGVRSAAERDAKRLWARAGLPEAQWNVAVYRADGTLVGIADCWVDGVAMVWEIESTEWHMSPDAHDRTVERAARFTAAGAVYVATKPKRLRTARREVARSLREVLEQAAARPRPALRAGPLRSSDVAVKPL